jgi:hypothetical protein
VTARSWRNKDYSDDVVSIMKAINVIRGVWFSLLAGKGAYDGAHAIAKGEIGTGKANNQVIRGPEAYLRGALLIAGGVSLALLAYECFFPRPDATRAKTT